MAGLSPWLGWRFLGDLAYVTGLRLGLLDKSGCGQMAGQLRLSLSG